jgi:DNA-binding transcriptional ArsR family regulator
MRSSAKPSRRLPPPATVFAALGDATRLALIARLSGGAACSIAELTAGTRLTRQAVTKHLRVLERSRVVRCRRTGRESRFAFNPQPLESVRHYLDRISSQWDDALARLQAFVES